MTTYPTWTPAAQQGIIPLHPLSFGQLFGRTFTALRRNPKVLLGFGVGFQVLGIVVTTVVIFLLTFLLESRLETVPRHSPEYDEMSAGNTVALFVVGVPLSLFVQALMVLVQGVVAAEVAGSVVAEKQTLRQLWARVRPAFWRLFGYALLLGTAMIAGAALAVAPFLILVATAGTNDVIGPLVGVLLMIALIFAYYAAVLWVSTKLVAVVPILVLERGKIFTSIARSWRLTRGRFWPTLGVLFLQSTIFAVIGQIIYTITVFLAMIFGGILNPLNSSESGILAMIVAAAIGLLLYVVISATGAVVLATAAALITVDLRMRHEGLDIDLLGYVERRDLGEVGLADPFAFDPARHYAPSPQLAPAQYGAPQYGMPYPPQYGMPQPPQYGMPQPPQYGMPQPPQYGMPQPPQYGMPQPPQYAAPQPPTNWPGQGSGG